MVAKFSVNDAVSFINEKQNGIVREVKPNGIYIVEIEGGFTLEATEKELVKVSKQTLQVKQEVTAPIISKEDSNVKLIDELTDLAPGIWIATVPTKREQVLTGTFDIYILNKSKFDCLAAVSLKNKNNFKGINALLIPADSEEMVSTIRRDDSINWECFYIQLLLYQHGEHKPQPAVAKELSILLPDLNGNTKLKWPATFAKYLQVINFEDISNDKLFELHEHFSAKDIEHRIKESKKTEKTKSAFERTPSQLEVDLHIEELTNNFSGMSNAEIITFQLEYFRKKLDEALFKRFFRITFIHGVGNGILKSEIRKELTSLHLKFTDGPYERYGGGATEVILS